MINDGPELNEIRPDPSASDDSDTEALNFTTAGRKRKSAVMTSSSDCDDNNESVPKKTIKVNYKQKYVASWEREFTGWLERKDGQAFCKFCHVTLGTKKSTLHNHMKSKKHTETCKLSDARNMKQISLDFSGHKGEKHQRLKAEAWAAMFVACHTSINSVDHLTEGCNRIFKNISQSKIAAMLMHRTKCTAVIRRVLAPYFRRKLVKDIGDMPFSLIIDETTDVQVKKILGIVLRYIDLKLRKVISTFLDMIEIEDGRAETIAKNVDSLLKKIGLKSENCIGLGVDNASAMIGIYSGVHVRLQEMWKRKLFLNKCVCHSIQLALSEACKLLTDKLDFLIKQSYVWFHTSTSRQQRYETLFHDMMKDDKDAKYLKLKQMAATRWISIYPALNRIVTQYNVLKAYFLEERTNKDGNTHMADLLYSCYNDLCIQAQLFYLESILKPVWIVNVSFQSDSNAFMLLDDLKKLILDLAKLVINKTQAHRVHTVPVSDLSSYVDPNPYFGENVERILKQIPNEIRTTVRKMCVSFTLKLIEELKDRLPDNMELLENIKELSNERCLRAMRNRFLSSQLLQKLGISVSKLNDLEYQWNTLSNVQWSNVGGCSPDENMKFWFEVYDYTNSAGHHTYRDLALLVFHFLSLPLSNAAVERLFSLLAVIKSKLRNSMLTETVGAIIAIRSGLLYEGKCCHDYSLPDDVLQEVGMNAKYTDKAITDEEAHELGSILESIARHTF